MSLQASRVEPDVIGEVDDDDVGITLAALHRRMRHVEHVDRVGDDALACEEAEGERRIVAGRPHGDGEALDARRGVGAPAQTDLQRLLDCHPILDPLRHPTLYADDGDLADARGGDRGHEDCTPAPHASSAGASDAVGCLTASPLLASMDPVVPFDWHRMFLGDPAPMYLLEVVFRVVVIYLFAVLALRVMGARGNRSLSPFETLVIIALGSATGDSMFYPDVPIVYAWLVIAAVVGLDWILEKLQLRSPFLNRALEGSPILLVRDGAIQDQALRSAGLRRDELMGLLRECEVADTGEIRYAFLELSGQIGLLRYAPDEAGTVESTLPDKVNG